jgi:hypothetical protein
VSYGHYSTECLVGTLCGPKLDSCMNMSRPTAWSATKGSLGFQTGPAPPGRRPGSAANRARSCEVPRATPDSRSQPDAAARRLLPGSLRRLRRARRGSALLPGPPSRAESAMGSRGRAGPPLPSGVTPCNLMSAQPGPKTSLLAQGFPTAGYRRDRYSKARDAPATPGACWGAPGPRGRRATKARRQADALKTGSD